MVLLRVQVSWDVTLCPWFGASQQFEEMTQHYNTEDLNPHTQINSQELILRFKVFQKNYELTS